MINLPGSIFLLPGVAKFSRFIMIVALNSLVHQEKGAQEEEEEEAGSRRWVSSIGTPTPGADALTCPTQSGLSDARNRRRHRWCGVPIHRRGRWG